MLGEGWTAPWLAVAPESVTDVAGREATVVPAKAKKQKRVVPANSPRKAIASDLAGARRGARSASRSCTTPAASRLERGSGRLTRLEEAGGMAVTLVRADSEVTTQVRAALVLVRDVHVDGPGLDRGEL